MIRSAAIREAARDEPCQLRIQDVCLDTTETTVACHSNWQEDGKGASQKADDIYIAFGCYACHCWLDSGKASREEKRDAFHRGMKRTWRRLIDKGVITVKGMKN